MNKFFYVTQAAVVVLSLSCVHRGAPRSGLKEDPGGLPTEFTELPVNYLVCQRDGDSVTGCRVADDKVVLIPNREVNLSYMVEYRSGCAIAHGKYPSSLELVQGSSRSTLLYDQAQWQTLGIFSGTEPFLIQDSKPSTTQSRRFFAEKDCFLKFRYKTELSDFSKMQMATHMSELKNASAHFKFVKSQAVSIETMMLNMEKLDLDQTKNLFRDFKDQLEKQLHDQIKIAEWNTISISIEEIMILNPSVDPQSKIDELVSRTMNDLLHNNSILIQQSATRLENAFVAIQHILAFARNDQFLEERKFLADIGLRAKS